MNAKMSLSGSLLLLLISLPSACTGRGQLCSADWLNQVFSGFTFVGAFPSDPGRPIPRHGGEPRPWPRELRAGLRYVFHSDRMITTEDVAVQLLPGRLKQAHVTVIDYPKTAGEFAIPNLGGPLWHIRFGRGNCEGTLSNRIDPDLLPSRAAWPVGSSDDYIVEIGR